MVPISMCIFDRKGAHCRDVPAGPTPTYPNNSATAGRASPLPHMMSGDHSVVSGAHRSSTPVSGSCVGGIAELVPGQDDQISPIVATKGDDHLRGNLNNPKAHDGSSGQVYDQLTANIMDQYKNPRQLQESRRTQWPAAGSIAQQYPALAQIYTAVKSTGLPNAMSAKIPLTTSLEVRQWEKAATGHPHDDLVLQGIVYGFPSQYWGPPRPTLTPGYNHTSADAFPEKVEAYITKELSEQALIGPFKTAPFEWVHYSPMMTRPKAGQDKTARRVIVDLSFPNQGDINSCITKNILNGSAFTHTLPTIDDLVNIIRAMHYDAYLYALDIARVYRNFRSDPLDWPLMGVAFGGELLIDTALPFGARNSSCYMQKIAEFIARALVKRGGCVLIYLDDVVGVAQTYDQAMDHFAMVRELLEDLGLPLALDKLAPPAHTVTWLGIKCDIPSRTLSLPRDKVKDVLAVITSLHAKDAMSRKEVQQLAGKINFIARVCRPARLFMSRVLAYLR